MFELDSHEDHIAPADADLLAEAGLDPRAIREILAGAEAE